MRMAVTPQIILITGNMASGKSTVAQALAERLPRSVHLRGDVFRRMIVNGQAEMGFALSEEAQRQLELRYELAIIAAKRYADAGLAVVYQDVIIGPWLSKIAAAFSGYRLAVVVLCPSAEVIAERERTRAKTGYPDGEAVFAFDRILREETSRIGFWLDNSSLSVEETVEKILNHLRLSTNKKKWP